MKKYSNVVTLYSALIMFVCCFTLSSCQQHDETIQEKTLKLLSSGTWHITNVTVDGVNRDDLFTGLTLTFSPGVYSSVNGEPVWPVSGAWIFSDGTAGAITRDDGFVVTITSLTEANLSLTLQWNKTTLGAGRISSISGNHVFEFGK